MKISEWRWNIAQKNEKNFWEKDWKKSLKENNNLVKEYWNYHKRILLHHIKLSKTKRVLEIGGGASAFIGYLPKAKKYSLDPLMDYFIKNFNMPRGVKYIKGKGEEIPFKKDFFDLVIITNVIDHVHNYREVLSEIRRVLKKKGIVYLSVDCHNFLLKKYRDFRERMGIGDPAHPHTFTLKDINHELKQSGFKILHIHEGIGDQGTYSTQKKPKMSFYDKITISLKEGGISRLFNSLAYRILNKIGEFTFPEKSGVDLIFILKKA